MSDTTPITDLDERAESFAETLLAPLREVATMLAREVDALTGAVGRLSARVAELEAASASTLRVLHDRTDHLA